MAVEDSHEFDSFAAHPVGDDVRRSGYDEFPGAREATGATHVGLSLQEVYGFQNAGCNQGFVLIGVLLDVLANRDQMPDCGYRTHFRRTGFESVMAKLSRTILKIITLQVARAPVPFSLTLN